MSIITTILTWLTSTGLGITTIVGIVIAFIAKIFPRDKLWLIVKPSAIIVGTIINNTLLKIFPKQAAVKVEEYVVCTLTNLVRMWCTQVEETVLSDNAIELLTGNAKIDKKTSIVSPIPLIEPKRNYNAS
jgi:hypothetical protein